MPAGRDDAGRQEEARGSKHRSNHHAVDEAKLDGESGIGDPAQAAALAAEKHQCRDDARKGERRRHREVRDRPITELELDHGDANQEGDEAVDGEQAVQPDQLSTWSGMKAETAKTKAAIPASAVATGITS